MKNSLTRRGMLATGATGLVTGIAGTALLGATPAHASEACGGLSQDEFTQYLTLFNNNDFGFTDYYHPDVVLELGNTQITTASGIRDFYAEVKQYVQETVQVNQFISDANGIATEFATEFRCIKDWEDSFFRRSLKAGEVMRRIGFVHYTVEDRKFKHIKTSLFRLVNDWRLESGA